MYYIIATSVVMAAAACLAALWPSLKGKFDRILAWFILIPALMIIVSLALGLAGRLTPSAMLFAHVTILVVVIVPWWQRRVAGHSRAVATPLRGPSIDGRTAPTRVRWGPGARPWLWLLGVVSAIALGWMVYAGLLMPPFGSDSLAYHLPPAVWWLQAGRIYPAPTQFTFGYGYPQGMSLLMLWQLAYTATDHLVNIVQVPFVVLGVLASYGLAREAGVGRPWAWWAGAFFGLTPIVLEQAVVPYTDVAVAALTLAALYLTLRFRRSGAGGYLWLAGVAVGLIVSIKANGVLVAAIVGLLALVPARRHKPLHRTIGLAILALGVPALCLGGYWYIRNLVLYDNPLFPAAVTVLGRTIFPGPRTIQNLLNVTPGQTPWQSFALALQDHSHWYTYDPPNGGFGPVFTILGIGAMVAAGLHALVTRRWWVVVQFGAGMLLLVLQPFKYPRYVLFLPALGGVGFAYVLQRMAGRHTRQFLQAAAAGLMLFTLLAVPYQPQLSAETFQQVRSDVAAGRPPSAATFGLARDYAFIDTIPELNHPDNRIAYTEAGYVYALMGRNRSNRVYYVPATSADEWLRKLKDAQTTFVIIGDDRATELRWIKQHPQDFVLWTRIWPYTIYVLRSDLPRNQALIAARGGGAQ
ncbi:MAG: hypothetical protein JWN15_463 [Firmicutes bacterium]|nr:hypothetical protein [Bacillota bacterium]